MARKMRKPDENSDYTLPRVSLDPKTAKMLYELHVAYDEPLSTIITMSIQRFYCDKEPKLNKIELARKKRDAMLKELVKLNEILD